MLTFFGALHPHAGRLAAYDIFWQPPLQIPLKLTCRLRVAPWHAHLPTLPRLVFAIIDPFLLRVSRESLTSMSDHISVVVLHPDTVTYRDTYTESQSQKQTLRALAVLTGLFTGVFVQFAVATQPARLVSSASSTMLLVLSPSKFLRKQSRQPSSERNNIVLTWQLANFYLRMAFVGPFGAQLIPGDQSRTQLPMGTSSLGILAMWLSVVTA
ncbi:hypothetical protein E4U54_002816 [Claviceps lovelessii]|nr:hypothetical protein E4U54_002816 [Claviceps lovelessii]